MSYVSSVGERREETQRKIIFAFLFLFSLAPSLHLSNPAHVYAYCSEQNVKSKFAGAENKPHSLCRVNKIKDITFHFKKKDAILTDHLS